MASALRKVYEDIWKRAFKGGKVELRFDTKTAAHAARWGLYAVKPQDCGEDLELQMARENCSITWTGELSIAIIRTDKSALFSQLMGQLPEEAAVGLMEESLGAFDEKASAARVLARVKEMEEEARMKEAIPDSILERARNKFGAR